MTQLRRIRYEHRETQQLATECAELFSRQLDQQIIKVQGPNNGTLLVPTKKAPDCLNVLKVTSNGQQVLHGGGVVFTYDAGRGCVVSQVSGLSVAAQPSYEFIFQATYL